MAHDFDVIVVGGGGAGLSAACHARMAGASVMVVEADTKLGGATALSSGVVYAAGTRLQREAGIQDSPEAMYQYMMALNQWSIRPALAKVLADGGASIIDWLVELGNDIPPHLIVESCVGGCPRGHRVRRERCRHRQVVDQRRWGARRRDRARFAGVGFHRRGRPSLRGPFRGCRALGSSRQGRFLTRLTAADERAETLILQALARCDSEVPIISEEAASHGCAPAPRQRFWLVDPLDGFVAFVEEAGRRSLIRCRAVPAEGATVVSSRSHGDAAALDAFLAGRRVAASVNAGSSLKLCLVATGAADLYPRLGRTMEWDIAACHAVLRAAGGDVRTLDGHTLRYGKPGLDNPHFVASGLEQPAPQTL